MLIFRVIVFAFVALVLLLAYLAYAASRRAQAKADAKALMEAANKKNKP